ncbi:hypothetical protein OWV82_004043 [Melia azedarach]|uniref:Uncharacterized protein n=1 Tax=Melia azedarach TaxID=155640 RepID=A0ACC1YPJ8_MELAZ|nr:hypothetical protein OWV82_004043 [Melia azedarach]
MIFGGEEGRDCRERREREDVEKESTHTWSDEERGVTLGKERDCDKSVRGTTRVGGIIRTDDEDKKGISSGPEGECDGRGTETEEVIVEL